MTTGWREIREGLIDLLPVFPGRHAQNGGKRREDFPFFPLFPLTRRLAPRSPLGGTRLL
jgi:hypothetical protein